MAENSGISSKQAIIIAVITGVVTIASAYIAVLPSLRTQAQEQQEVSFTELKEKYEEEIEELRGALEKSGGRLVVSNSPIGTIITSTLSFSEFCEAIGQKRGPSNFDAADQANCLWSPADGRSCVGSQYAKFGHPRVPDLRGVFLRGLNQFDTFEKSKVPQTQKDPDPHDDNGFQADMLVKHNHIYHAGTMPYTEQKTGGETYLVRPANKNTSDAGGNETRPKNIAVYRYIKIN